LQFGVDLFNNVIFAPAAKQLDFGVLRFVSVSLNEATRRSSVKHVHADANLRQCTINNASILNLVYLRKILPLWHIPTQGLMVLIGYSSASFNATTAGLCEAGIAAELLPPGS
jgi:hypothetical protein